jgi:hypothetical protein
MMARNEDKQGYECEPFDWDIGAVSDGFGGSLRTDNGAVNQKVGGIASDHAVSRRYQKPGAGFDNPPGAGRDATDRVTAAVFGRDHVDTGQVKPAYGKEMGYNPGQPDERGPGSSVARAKRSSAHEYYGDGEDHWYGAPNSRQE